MNARDELERDADAKQKKEFEYMVEGFIKRWRSNDRYDGAQFEAELITIIRQVYTDAQAPLLKHITDIAMRMPFPPMLKP